MFDLRSIAVVVLPIGNRRMREWPIRSMPFSF